jgi:hypothetical protein
MKYCDIITPMTGPRYVRAPGRLIIWGLFKPIFFKYFMLIKIDVVTPLIGWLSGKLPG